MSIYTIENGKAIGLINLINKEDLDLNSLSWSEIKAIIQIGEFSNYFNVGDTKDIILDLPIGSSNLTTNSYFSNAVSGVYKVVVLGIDHNSKYEGKNRIHFCISQDSTGREIAFHDQKMNISLSNTGGWASSQIKTWLNNTLLRGLPSDLVSVITPCNKYTDNTGDSSTISDNITVTSDKLWLLSEFEVFGSRTYANPYEKDTQAQYNYYKNKDSKIRYKHFDTSLISDWWLRSANSNLSDSFCCVFHTDDIASDYANQDYGVVPCFTIN